MIVSGGGVKGEEKKPPSALKPFELEGFLRDEAKIAKDEKRAKYKKIFEDQEVDEARLHLLTDAMLKEMGINLPLDRASILEAAKRRTSGKME